VDTAVWIAQGSLAAAFLAAGGMKLIQSKARLETGQPWVADFSQRQIRGIGLFEVLGAFGLLLPAITDMGNALTVVAAVGLALLMLGAATTHVRRREFGNVVPNIILFALAVFVFMARLTP